MTTHTIPADHLDAARRGVLVVYGERQAGCVEAWPDCVSGDYNPWCCRFPKTCSVRDVAPAEFVKLTEPCETCDGSGHATFGNQVRTSEKCPACDGSGRPLFRVDVEHICFHEGQRLLIKEVCDCGTDNGVIDSFRAHVLDVVPIVDDGENMPRPFVLKDGGSGTSLWWLLDDPLNITAITLPPGEHLNKWAVLLEVER